MVRGDYANVRTMYMPKELGGKIAENKTELKKFVLSQGTMDLVLD